MIVWSAFVTVKLCATGDGGRVDGVAGLVGLHGARARADQRDRSHRWRRPTVHTAGVVVENVTGSPDDAVALTVTGDCARVLVGRARRT